MDNSKESNAFTCLRCGNCCQGEGGIVLTDTDRNRLCNHLNMDLATFTTAYVETVSGKNRLRTDGKGWCIFFAEGCTVHPAKPTICRAWPFFRGNMVDATSWQMAQDACSGINAGSSHTDFVAQGKSYLHELEIDPSSESGPNALRDTEEATQRPDTS